MILDRAGKLSKAQDLNAGAADSQNVIEVAAVDYAHPTGLWWVVDTETVAEGGTTSTYKFQLVLAQEATLDNTKEVLSVTVTGSTDKRIATAGRHIVAVNIGKMLKDMLGADGSDYEFIGMISTLADGNGDASVSINAALSNSEPPSEYQAQVVDSNVGIPDHASAGS